MCQILAEDPDDPAPPSPAGPIPTIPAAPTVPVAPPPGHTGPHLLEDLVRVCCFVCSSFHIVPGCLLQSRKDSRGTLCESDLGLPGRHFAAACPAEASAYHFDFRHGYGSHFGRRRYSCRHLEKSDSQLPVVVAKTCCKRCLEAPKPNFILQSSQHFTTLHAEFLSSLKPKLPQAALASGNLKRRKSVTV